MEGDLTLNDMTADPLIALLMKADGVESRDLEALLAATRRAEVERLELHLRRQRAEDFYRRLDLSLAASSRPAKASRPGN
ncbi:hypothetical protein [Rhizobium sp. CSW-27]|uniref:hypothetical protein n=1 Tax=Rhizobium sp. CSW-27 TaxID=2839985 RepID=UPI001C027482|nr:hypothetical protein [Rhizobium sp. CSW-27]MBT9371086.1 hypothetical protein [Rhizobium sp. CSW-27]